MVVLPNGIHPEGIREAKETVVLRNGILLKGVRGRWGFAS
jgi:hypothetical protein